VTSFGTSRSTDAVECVLKCSDGFSGVGPSPVAPVSRRSSLCRANRGTTAAGVKRSFGGVAVFVKCQQRRLGFGRPSCYLARLRAVMSDVAADKLLQFDIRRCALPGARKQPGHALDLTLRDDDPTGGAGTLA
jgi:hypothetical protein